MTKTFTQRELIAGLKDQYRALTSQAKSAELALEAFGIDPSTVRVASGPRPQANDRPARSSTARRQINGPAVEAEIIRVLDQSGGRSMTAREIYESGAFECTQAAIPHAAARIPDRVETVKVDKTRLYSLKR